MIVWTSTTASAAVWSGGTGNWSSNGSPGWNGTGVPNAPGAVAEFNASSGTTSQDLPGGVTVGTVRYTGSPTGDRQLAPGVGGITLNQDGAGPGLAVVSNACSKRISFNTTGSTTLADDLLLVNAGSGAGTYAISFTSTIGGTGSITFDNISNDLLVAPIYLQSSANSFVGSVLVRRGSATLGNAALGGAANAVTLGAAGCGSASLATTGSSTTLPNPITIASGTGGTLLLGSTHAGTSLSTFSGAITLNDSLSVTSVKTDPGILRFTGAISGAGGLVKIGVGPISLTTANDFAGGTTVNAGSLLVTGSGTLGSGGVVVAAGALLDLATSTAIADGAAVALARTGELRGRIRLGTGVGETVDTLTLGGRLQPAGTYGATGSGATHVDDAYFLGGGVLTAVHGRALGSVVTIR